MNRRLRLGCAAAVIAAALAVAGCSATASGLDTQTSAEWQSRVLAIAESAEADDIPTALLDLDALETETTQARADGDISAERAAIIQQSIAVVRSDLEADVAVTPSPEETTTDDTGTDDTTDTDKGDKGNSENKSDNGKKNDDNGNGNNGKDDDD
ncbi:hypothetical protein [Microbacterium sp. TPD7012]|uniref:hypothetical protein n=1 Tax=Microbacterium sp. TPD7012 TaxID=2171975 RepID=UPI000D51580B|nr:hypothetical protein [Microbacterium sp. TPD7012]PVE94643.1 hypothetical protein DC434_11815 [Microbacterium sp. TPD7012]